MYVYNAYPLMLKDTEREEYRVYSCKEDVPAVLQALADLYEEGCPSVDAVEAFYANLEQQTQTTTGDQSDDEDDEAPEQGDEKADEDGVPEGRQEQSEDEAETETKVLAEQTKPARKPARKAPAKKAAWGKGSA